MGRRYYIAKIDFDATDTYNKIIKSAETSLRELSDKIIEDTKPEVPYRTGLLSESGKLDKSSKRRDSIKIDYSRRVMYDGHSHQVAGAVYEGINPIVTPPRDIYKWSTPGREDHWFETSRDKHIDEWAEFIVENTREKWRKRKRK